MKMAREKNARVMGTSLSFPSTSEEVGVGLKTMAEMAADIPKNNKCST